MIKYTSEQREAFLECEKNRKGTGASFFSSKEGNDNYFGSQEVVGQRLKVTGIQNVVPEEGSTIKPFNVVIFDDGHQLSTSRLFSAKGIKWPVGGNVAKMNYLLDTLEEGKKDLICIPKSVESKPLEKDGKFYANGKWQEGTKEGSGKNIKVTPPAGTVMLTTYTFENVQW